MRLPECNPVITKNTLVLKTHRQQYSGVRCHRVCKQLSRGNACLRERQADRETGRDRERQGERQGETGRDRERD